METIDVQLDAAMMKDLEERAESLHLFASEYASLVITNMMQNHKTSTDSRDRANLEH